MFKILIADDEKFIRKGIISILMRNLSEEVECLEAKNGFEALELSQKELPNLIITDINMPGCDGLEFVKKLKKQQVNIPVVILSGYENFEYAKQAIKLGVKEYVMKPIKKMEFIDLIQGYLTDIKEKQIESKEQIVKKIEQTRIMEGLKQDFLVGLLKCLNSEEAKRYLVRLKELGMTFASKLYTCAVVQYEVSNGNQEYIDFAVKNVLDEYLILESEGTFVVNVAYDYGRIVVIFEGDSQEDLKEPKKKMLRRAAGLIKEYCKVKVFVGLGDVAYDSIHLHIALRHALLATNFKIYEEGDVVSVYEKLLKGNAIVPPQITKEWKSTEQLNVFATLDKLQQIIRSEKSIVALLILQKEYEEIQELVENRLKQKSKPKPFAYCWTMGQLKAEVKQKMELLKEAKKEEQATNTLMIHKVLQFVDSHITEELDLNLIAEQFNRTPGYISTLFKKHTASGFNHYLTKKRVEIAKKLLKNSMVSVQEVGEMCGYNNPKYFSVVFKKETGQTPRDYRKEGSFLIS